MSASADYQNSPVDAQQRLDEIGDQVIRAVASAYQHGYADGQRAGFLDGIDTALRQYTETLEQMRDPDGN